jgi:hypothetical protein
MANTKYRNLTAGLIAAWFIFSLSASALHLFKTDPGRPPLPLLVGVLTPIALFFLWYQTSEGFREFTLSLNPRTLTMIQVWRIEAFTFLVLHTYGILPGSFALPAGWGDIAIGATALPVALTLANSNHRKSFILWQLLGITDLVSAITLGAVARFISAQEFSSSNGITTAPMTVLPLSLIPTFAVPFLFILHVICIAQARRWSEQPRAHVGGQIGSLAA